MVRGYTYQQGNRLWDNTGAFSIEWMPTHSLLFFLSIYHSPSSPSLSPPSVGYLFPYLFKLFHRYLVILTRENNAASCFGCSFVPWFFLHLSGKKQAQWQTKWHKESKTLKGTNRYADGVISLRPYFVQSVFTSEL